MGNVWPIALLTASWLVLGGCADKESTWGDPFRSCDDRVGTVVEHDYYVATANWGEDENVGFDLDEEVTVCESGCINDGLDGVDNRMHVLEEGLGDMLGISPEELCAIPLCFLQSDIERGDLNVLIRARLGEISRDRYCREYFLYNGFDMDADPSDNLSGIEPFLVTRSSIAEYGYDLTEHALFRFDSGGEFLGEEYRPHPTDRIELALRVASGELVPIPLHRARISVTRTDFGIAGMIGGFIPVEFFYTYMFRPEVLEWIESLGDDDPEGTAATVMNIIVNQADGDMIPGGPTGDVCITAEDCLVPWRDCNEDGLCVEPPNRMDAISATIVYRAVPCEITGIAEE